MLFFALKYFQFQFSLARFQYQTVILFCGTIFLISSCGKRRPPTAPLRVQSIANNLSATQQGNQIILKIAVSAKTVKQINVYRLNELQSSSLYLSADDFARRATLIGTINELSEKSDEGAFYNDPLSSLINVGRLRYAVRLVYADGRRSESTLR